jgi:CRP/FNR family transcriptional regulator
VSIRDGNHRGFSQRHASHASTFYDCFQKINRYYYGCRRRVVDNTEKEPVDAMNESILSEGTIFDFLKTKEVNSRILSFSNGQTVFEPNDPASHLFLMQTGEIRLFQTGPNGRRSLLAILGPGELFGLSSLGRLAGYGKLAISVGDSEVIVVPADRLQNALLSHGNLAIQLVELLAHQLHSIWTEGSELFLEDCRFRLIRKLIGFAGSPAATPAPGGVELRITHAQLAQAIGAARETVSICLMELRRENLVETRRNRVIYDPERLRLVDANRLANNESNAARATPPEPYESRSDSARFLSPGTTPCPPTPAVVPTNAENDPFATQLPPTSSPAHCVEAGPRTLARIHPEFVA